jgi:hypothetical protein
MSVNPAPILVTSSLRAVYAQVLYTGGGVGLVQVLSFDQSGKGEVPMTLADVQEIALGLGYAKEGVAASKPLGARVTMGPFFDQYGVKAFSNFKKKFFDEPLVPIGPGGTPMAAKSTVRPDSHTPMQIPGCAA